MLDIGLQYEAIKAEREERVRRGLLAAAALKPLEPVSRRPPIPGRSPPRGGVRRLLARLLGPV